MPNHYPVNPRIRAAVSAVLSGCALAMTFGVASAHGSSAQEANSQTSPSPAASASAIQLQEVVVTGSLIAPTPGQVQMSVVSSITPEQIQQTGATGIEDVLNRLPQVQASQSLSSNGTDETATVDLRDLGAKRTLVLVNGMRMNPGDPRTGSAADLNMIPAALISNVQVLTGGSSTIYGADAAAGVVNFQLNDHFQGLKVVLNGGIYNHANSNSHGLQTAITRFNSEYNPIIPFEQAPSSFWGGAQKSVTVIAGLNAPDGKGNATFYLGYRDDSAVLNGSFSYGACTLASGYIAGKKNTGGNFNCSGSATGYPGNFEVPNSTGKLTDYTIVPSTGQLVPFNNSALFNYSPQTYMHRPDERYSAGALIHYTFNPHVTFYANTMFMDDQSNAQLAPNATFLDTYKVNCSNPFLSPSEMQGFLTPVPGSTTGRLEPCADNPGGISTLYLGVRDIWGGNRAEEAEHLEFQENLGFKGNISSAWKYNAAFQYGFTSLNYTEPNQLSLTKLNDAFDVVNVNGTPECAVTVAGNTTAQAQGCVPFNIFGNGGSAYLSPTAAQGYISTPDMERGQIRQYIAQLTVNGDLSEYGIRVPAASSGVKLALGTDYREDADSLLPDEEYQADDLTGQGRQLLPVNGDIITREAFGEVLVPLVNNEPFVQTLSMDGSYRYSDYSPPTGGAEGFKTNTYAFSADWKPSHDYTLRVDFARAVRAPNVSELYTPQTISLDGTQDPCAGAQPAYSESACARTGVTPDLYGFVQSNPASQYAGLTGGNPDLSPETVLTTTEGFTWTPSYVPTLRANVDYYDIKVENVIEQLGENTILNQCVVADLFCSAVHRGAGETLWFPGSYVSDTEVNSGQIEEKGFDFEASYSLGLHRWGRLQAHLASTYVASYEITPFPNDTYNCAGYYGGGCAATGEGAEPLPKYRQDLRLTWVTPWKAIDLSAAWRFVGHVELYSLSPNPNLGCVATTGCSVTNGLVPSTDAQIPSYNYLDLTASGQLPETIGEVSWRLGVNNVLDTNPPFIGSSSGGIYAGVYDALGRFVFGELSVQL